MATEEKLCGNKHSSTTREPESNHIYSTVGM